MSGRRLERGGKINREREIHFHWNEEQLIAHPGDTLASALLANGKSVIGRSFKYHRPRGITSAGVEESGALITLGNGPQSQPNIRATEIEMTEGIRAYGQNAWPSVDFDLKAVNGLANRFLGAGFYYKTFMGPGTGTRSWMFYEKFIRRAAGLGEASRFSGDEQYDIVHHHCDVLIAGSGPAGLAAARTLAQAGKQVILAEQDFDLGGWLLWSGEKVDGIPASEWLTLTLRALEEAPNVHLMRRTTVFGLYDHSVAGLIEYVGNGVEKQHIVRSRHTIIASGAMERIFAFSGNDKPGVMNATAAATYVGRYGVTPGNRIAFATNNDATYQCALNCANAGIDTVIVDARPSPPATLAGRAVAAGIEVRPGLAPAATLGIRKLKGARLARQEARGWRLIEDIPCDVLAVSGGFSPLVNLAGHRGMKPRYDNALAAFVSTPLDEPVEICGAAAGIFSTNGCIASGVSTANRIITGTRDTAGSTHESPSPAWEVPILPLWEVKCQDVGGKAFVDLLNDVTSDDIRLANAEGFRSVEHLKRYTTLGMAPDQGKVGNVTGIALLAQASDRTIGETGTTTFRPPYTPVTIGALSGRTAGKHWRAERLTPLHHWNLENGGVMTEAGLWLRPWYHPIPGEELNDAYVREMKAVRENVGMVDVSTLGKIAVQGPDAAEFLDRVYVNGFRKLPIGKARYGVMLRDDGVVMDDGTTWRLDEYEYFMTTTTAGAGHVMTWLESLLETRWPELRVRLTSVSDQWGGLAVAGPNSREVLQAVFEDLDLQDQELPFMGVREFQFEGMPHRIARLSFSGELAYEVYTLNDACENLAQKLWRRIQARNGVLYGTEALGGLRIEKGHVAGPELDGRTSLADLGLERMASRKKPFIGKVLAGRPGIMDPLRPALVGIEAVETDFVLQAGALLFEEGRENGHGIGWVSSVTYSPECGRHVALGFIEGGLQKHSQKSVVLRDFVRDKRVRVNIRSGCFIDPEGIRLHA